MQQSINIRILLIIIIFSIFLSGCSVENNVSNRGELNYDYKTGSKGLYLRFMNNLPPYKLYDDEPFDVVVEVHNVGSYDITSGDNSRIYLSGFDPQIILGIPTEGKLINDLEGRSLYNENGNTKSIEFRGSITSLSALDHQKYEFNLMATACYEYNTVYQQSICIDPDPSARTSKTRPCTVTNPPAGSQGAPIAITSVIEEAQPHRTRFKFTVKNVGGGTVFKDGYEYLSKCNPNNEEQLAYDDIDYVKVMSVKVSDNDITDTCKPLRNGYLKLNGNTAYFVCDFQTAGSVYTTTLRVELEYGYRSTISKRIQIISTDTY